MNIKLSVIFVFLFSLFATAGFEAKASTSTSYTSMSRIRPEQVKHGARRVIVKAFQYQHGLKADGIIGPKTKKAKMEEEMGLVSKQISVPTVLAISNVANKSASAMTGASMPKLHPAKADRRAVKAVTFEKVKEKKSAPVSRSIAQPEIVLVKVPNISLPSFSKLAVSANNKVTANSSVSNSANTGIRNVKKKANSVPRRATVDPRIDPSLLRAANIASNDAFSTSHGRCWRYVKRALLSAGAVFSYPKTENAKEAGRELTKTYGFKKLSITDPYAAPVGAVVVYYSDKSPGHVEIRTETGFVSDYEKPSRAGYPVSGIYAKYASL